MLRIKRNIINRQEAFKLAPDYVCMVENDEEITWDKFLSDFYSLKKGDAVITFIDGKYVRAKVSMVKGDCPQAVDGPVIRVDNGEQSWRVDGDQYAYRIAV
jgi:hypothetical protein